jgi:hypothetical protein
LTQFLNDLFSTLIRLVLIVSGLVVGGIVLLLALTLGAGVLVWSLLTGRKPVFRFAGLDPRATMAGMRARAQAHAPRQPGRRAQPVEVIDIEAREVPDRRD